MNPLIQLKYENTTEQHSSGKEAEQEAERDTFHFCTDHTLSNMAYTGSMNSCHPKDLRHE